MNAFYVKAYDSTMLPVRAPSLKHCVILTCALAVAACASREAIPVARSDGAAAEPVAASLARSNDVLYAALDAKGYGSIVDVFTPQGKLTTRIVDGLGTTIGGVAIDEQGRIYADEAAAGIVAYANGLPTPAGFYGNAATHNAYPLNLAIFKKTIYAELAPSLPQAHSVLLEYPVRSYPLGETRAKRVITLPNFIAGGLAVDSKGDVFVNFGSAANFPQPGKILEIKPNAKAGKVLKPRVGNAGPGLAVDSQGNLVECDNEYAKVFVFRRKQNGDYAAKPERSIGAGLADCGSLVFSSSGKLLYVDNQPIALGDYGTPAKIDVYNYASGRLLKTITRGFDQPANWVPNLAVNPPASPGP